MKATVYGPGCTNCEQLAENTKKAAEELDLDLEVKKVEDVNEMTEVGVFTTPGLAVDGELKITGRVPEVEEIKSFLS